MGRVALGEEPHEGDLRARPSSYPHPAHARRRGPDAARKYLAPGGFGGEVPKKWMLGYAPGRGALVRHLSALGFKPDEMIRANVALDGRGGPVRDRFYERVMFPIFDAQGDCVAFGGRVIGTGEPKYLNSQETPLFHKSQVLYGLDQAKARMASTGCAIVVEGYTDVIALHEAGVTNVVATLGTALTMRHIRVLAKHAPKKIVYLFDGDAAGQKAADRALAFIGESISDKNRNSVGASGRHPAEQPGSAEFVQAEWRAGLGDGGGRGAPAFIEFGPGAALSTASTGHCPGAIARWTRAWRCLPPSRTHAGGEGLRRAPGRVCGPTGASASRRPDVLERLAALEAPRGGSRGGGRARGLRTPARSPRAFPGRAQPPALRARVSGARLPASPCGARPCRCTRAGAVA